MTSDPLFAIVIIAILLVLGILIFGLTVFVKGGEFNRKHANKIMRARLVVQAIAIGLILLFIFLRSRGA